MASVSVTGSVRVDAPEGVTVTPRVAPATSAALGAAAGAAADHSVLAEGLRGAGFEVAADFDLHVSAPARQLGAAAQPVRVRVDVKAKENAVLLLEAPGGVFAWSFPQDRHAKPAGLGVAPAARGLSAGTLVFNLTPSEHQDGVGISFKSLKGSPVWDWVVRKAGGAIRTRVLKFVIGKLEDFAVDRIEGGLKSGLTSLAHDDPRDWRVGGDAVPSLTGAKKLLLMVHGTFSTTTGSYGGLAAGTAGPAFLKAARSRYDAVVGFDHRTLGQGVEQNARDIMQALAGLPQGAHIDAVAYSRGGLVYRTFAEEILAAQRPDIRLGKCVFVGCTNGGTHLAEPDNWAAMVDLYTSIALAATKLLTRLAGPGARAVGMVVSELIRLLGKFVQYLSVVAITDRRVPGLADMEPDSQLVKRLNAATTGSERLADYFVITSNFVPKLDPDKGMTAELVEMLLDRITNRLFKTENDLVVDTRSMALLGGRQARLKETNVFNYGDVEDIYHTIYFGADRTAQQLSTWLLT